MNSALAAFCCGWPEIKRTSMAHEYHHLLGKRLPEELYSIFIDENDCMCVTKHEMWICLSSNISSRRPSGCGFVLSFMYVRLSGSF